MEDDLEASERGPEAAETDKGFSKVRRKRRLKEMDISEAPEGAEAVKRPSFPPVNISTALVSQLMHH